MKYLSKPLALALAAGLGVSATSLLSGCMERSTADVSDDATAPATASADDAATPAVEVPADAAKSPAEVDLEPAENAEPAPVEETAETTTEKPDQLADAGEAAKPKAEQVAKVDAKAADDRLAAVDKNANPDIEPGDWPMWAGTPYRNNTPKTDAEIPIEWDTGEFDRETGEWISDEAENIKWVARLGSQSYGNPVVASGHVLVGTNNGGGWLPRYPNRVDLGCLLAFEEETGEFKWQDSSEKLPTGRVHDWPLQGICCAPYMEGDRLWYVSSRGEVKCLDLNGYYDGKDDGEKAGWGRLFDVSVEENAEAAEQLQSGEFPGSLRETFAERGEELPEGEIEVQKGEQANTWTFTAEVDGVEREFKITQGGPNISAFKQITTDDKHEADVIWVYNMMEELGSSQHNMSACSIVGDGDLLFVNTSNGVDFNHLTIPAPDAPSFFCIDKNTAEVYWTDKSPGENILHGQWSSPTLAELGGVKQVIFAGGDGWVYSFKADKGENGKPELLWKFDANPKTSKWVLGGAGTRNNIIATPVVYDGLVYVAVGQDPEHLDGEGHLWCIDPTQRGDVSPELAMKLEGEERTPIEHRRLQAVIAENGEVAVDNPNSAVVWHYDVHDLDGDGEIDDYMEKMHRTIGTPAIVNDLLFISDFSGIFHCVDAKTGELYWTYDMLSAAWGSPLIVNGKIYVGDEDGDVTVFNATKEKHDPLAEINMGNSVYSTPVVANGKLFIANRTHLFCITEGGE